MFRQVLFFVCAVSLCQVIIGQSIDYRCGANGCLNGAECQSNGKCKCSGTQYGAYCDIGGACDAGTVGTCTANTITNTGTALNECYVGDDTQCICKDGFTGTICDEKILEVDCAAAPTSFIMTVRPHRYSDLTAFSGEVYFAADTAKFDDLATLDPACKIAAVSSAHSFDTSAAATGCGAATKPTTDSVKYYAYIKHNANIKSVEDQIIEVTCDTASSKAVSIINTVIDSSKFEVQQTTISTVDDVTMKIRKDGGPTLTDFQVHDTVRVNDNIALTLESTSPFLVKSCEVNDGVASTTVKIPVIDAWCVGNAGLLVYSSKIVALESTATAGSHAPHGLTDSTNAVKLPLKAVKFTSGSKMMFTCELCTRSGCAAAFSTCNTNLHIGGDFKTYQDAVHGAGLPTRRRRSVTNGTTGTSISVSVSVDELKDILNNTNESKETECFKSAVVLLPLILLASLLVIAMGMTFFFCNKFTKNMTEGQSNIGFKA